MHIYLYCCKIFVDSYARVFEYDSSRRRKSYYNHSFKISQIQEIWIFMPSMTVDTLLSGYYYTWSFLLNKVHLPVSRRIRLNSYPLFADKYPTTDKTMKDKPNSTRIYDEDGFRRRAACICVRKDSDEVIIILMFYT